MDSLPVELLEVIGRCLRRDDLLSLSLTSRRYLKITNKLVTFCATASGLQQLRTVATALEWSYRIKHRMMTLVLSDSHASTPATGLQSDSLETSSEAGTKGSLYESIPPASVEASQLMLDILAVAKNVRDVQITGFCLSVQSLSRSLAARRHLRRFAFNPFAAAGVTDAAVLVHCQFGFERIMAVLTDNRGLRELHLRDLRSDAEHQDGPNGIPASKTRAALAEPFYALPDPVCSLVVLDLNRPIIHDSELVTLLQAHHETLRDVCVVFHESQNILTPAGVQRALAPCAGALQSLHLGFNRSTRHPIEDVLPGDLVFPNLRSVATCAIIMPRLKGLRNFPTLKFLRTNSLSVHWIHELEELVASGDFPKNLKGIGVIHRSTVPEEGEAIKRLAEAQGIELRYWSAEMAALSLL